MQASPQQQACIDFVANQKGNLVVEACAGSGKTTTIFQMAKVVPPTQKIALVAFNKSIANELKERAAKMGLPNVTAGTAHSFGFQALRRANRNIKVEPKKVSLIMQKMEIPAWYRDVVGKLVSHAKQGCMGCIVTDTDEAWVRIFDHHDMSLLIPQEFRSVVNAKQEAIRLARAVLEVSNRDVNTIDFDDQVYLPLLCGLKPFQYNVVFLDEAQDTNEARRALIRAMMLPTGRLIAVGDAAQAIYGFTGANHDSLDLIRRDFQAASLPLSVTYRCAKSVTAVAQKWNKEIVAADSSPEGEILEMDYADMLTAKPVGPETAILCRKTAPLVRTAYALMRKGIACKVEGREIGAGLVKLVRKWRSTTTVSSFLTKLREWGEVEKQKAIVKQKQSLIETIEDQVEALHEIAAALDGRDPISALEARIDGLFGDDVQDAGVLTLATIHRSKGREWETVYWLGSESYQPSPWARQDWQMTQEYNLMYVCATRAKHTLVFVTAPPEQKQREAA